MDLERAVKFGIGFVVGCWLTAFLIGVALLCRVIAGSF